MAHPNENLVRRGFDAFSKGDVDTLRELFDQDAVWHTPVCTPSAASAKEEPSRTRACP
jgi:ketosteroid isomerase-like protein